MSKVIVFIYRQQQQQQQQDGLTKNVEVTISFPVNNVCTNKKSRNAN